MITPITYMHAAMNWLIVASCYFTAAIGYQRSFVRFVRSVIFSIHSTPISKLNSVTTATIPCDTFSLHVKSHVSRQEVNIGIVLVVTNSNAPSAFVRSFVHSVGPLFNPFDTDSESSKNENRDDCNNNMCYFLFTCNFTCIKKRNEHL